VASKKATNTPIYIAYYLTLTAYLIASFFPELRIWGINWWAFYPGWVRWGLFGLGLVIPVFVHLVGKRLETPSVKTERGGRDRMYFVVAALATLVAALLFYLLRARTHFQGDGYTLLSGLAKDSPFAMKTREFGESIVHIGLKDLIGGDGQTAALLSYQIISIAAGLFFVLLAAWFSYKLYERMAERLLFLLGLGTGGYMLLFFGYVENYSLFVLSVLAFTLTGLLIAQRKIRRFWILPPLAASVFFHILGVTLLPAALCIWIGPSRLGRTIQRWRMITKSLVLVAILIGAAMAFYHFYTTNYFFRFAFVPLFESRFTVEGYTLFSWKHLADCLNLLLLLMPGLLVALATLFQRSFRYLLKQRQYVYLTILMASVLGAVFVFDPKLGMPRDWDLFSFAGVPLVVLVICSLLATDSSIRSRVLGVGCTVALAVLLLVPRAYTLANTEMGLALIENQLLLDQLKSKNVTTLLGNYYVENGNSESARRVWRYVDETFPQDSAGREAMSLVARGQCRQAERILLEVLKRDPLSWNAWTTLGACYFYLNQPDSAMEALDIALGINPHGPRALNNKAGVCMMQGDCASAEGLWLESHRLDTLPIEPLAGLVELYKATRQAYQYHLYLLKLTSRTAAPMPYHRDVGDYFLTIGQFEAAAKAYHRALEKGLDSSYVLGLLSKYPELQRAWR